MIVFLIASIVAFVVIWFCPIILLFVSISLKLVKFLGGSLSPDIELEEKLKELLYVLDPVFDSEKSLIFSSGLDILYYR